MTVTITCASTARAKAARRERDRPPRQIRLVSDSYARSWLSARTPSLVGSPACEPNWTLFTGHSMQQRRVRDGSDRCRCRHDIGRSHIKSMSASSVHGGARRHIESHCPFGDSIAADHGERASAQESSSRCDPMLDRGKTLPQPAASDLAQPLVAPINHPTRPFQQFGAGVVLLQRAGNIARSPAAAADSRRHRSPRSGGSVRTPCRACHRR